MPANIRDRYHYLLEAMRISSETERDDYDFVLKRMLIFSDYVNQVYKMQIEMSVVHDRLSGDDVPAKIQEVDRKRRGLHDQAIDAVNQLNRLCDSYNVEHLFAGDTGDRQAVAEFCMEAVKCFFDNRNINRR